MRELEDHEVKLMPDMTQSAVSPLIQEVDMFDKGVLYAVVDIGCPRTCLRQTTLTQPTNALEAADVPGIGLGKFDSTCAKKFSGLGETTTHERLTTLA